MAAVIKRRFVVAVMAAIILISMAWSTLSSRFNWDFSLPRSGPLPSAQWRFLDADTGKPLAGVWVNFAWNVPMKERRGMRTCIRAVLAQSDAEGYVRDTAGDHDWVLSALPGIFMPGYEGMNYEFRKGDLEARMITAIVNQDQNYKGDFPPWERKLEELGFVWQQPEWTKRLRLPQRPGIESERPFFRRTMYMWTYRSMPDQVDHGAFQFVGRICDQPNAENIGLERERVAISDRERGLASARYLCRAEWDEIPKGGLPDMSGWLMRTFWFFLERGVDVAELVRREHPNVWQLYAAGSYNPNELQFSADVRKSYCKWLEQESGETLYVR
jgi:hypothetical protein